MATQRQKKAIANLLENPGSVSRAMRDAGYSPATAKNPKELTESVAFKSIADQIPDDLLVKVHREGLKAKSFRYSPEGELVQLDDFATRHKYLESAYKLKKVLDGEGTKLNLAIMFDPTFNASTPKAEGDSR